MISTFANDSTDRDRRPDCLRFHHCHGQNLHLADVSAHLRHGGFQESNLYCGLGMRCMGHSRNILPRFPVPSFLWNVESQGHIHRQVHQSAGVLQGNRVLEHGTRRHHFVYAAVHGLETET